MAALTAARNTVRRERAKESHPLKAATTAYQGGIACLDASGWAVPGSAATTLKAVGVFEETVVNAGANGEKAVKTRRGIFRFGNSTSGDAITRADINNSAYIVDDQTVAKTNGSSTRSVAGTIRDVDAQGVWVEF